MRKVASRKVAKERVFWFSAKDFGIQLFEIQRITWTAPETQRATIALIFPYPRQEKTV
jgi:hypothetical protein